MRKLLIILTAFLSLASLAQTEVPLSMNDAYINQKRDDNLAVLFDGNISTALRCWNPMIKPFRITFYLPANTHFSSVKLYVNNGNPSTQRYYYVRKADGRKILFFSYAGGYWTQAYQTFSFPETDTATKLILESDNGADWPEELHFYGRYTQASQADISVKHYPIKNMIGVVVHPWDIDITNPDAKFLFVNRQKYEMLKKIGVSHVRIYANAGYINLGYGSYNFDGWRIRKNIQKLHDSLGIDVQYCYQSQAPDVKATWPVSSHLNFFYQYNNDSDRLQKSSYNNMGHDAAMIVRNSGGTMPAEAAFEGGNELGAWWGGYNTYMTGQQQAAMISNICDSIKKINPSIPVSNAGIAWDRPDPFFEMVDYWNDSCGGKIPLDYWSYHTYPSIGGQYSQTMGGVPPEYITFPAQKRMVQWAYKYGGGRPVNIGEFNWDVDSLSPINAPEFNGRSAENVRAIWGVRHVLNSDEAGIYTNDFYRFQEDYYMGDPRGGNYASDNSHEQFSTMSLARQLDDTGHFVLNDIGDCLGQISRNFGNYVFEKSIRDDSVKVKQFSDGQRTMIAVWSVENITIPQDYGSRPTITERKGTIDLPYTGTKYNLSHDSSGVMKQSLVSPGAVAYNSEPFFIVVEKSTPLPIHFISFTAEKVNKAVVLKWIVEGTDNITVERSTDGRNFTPLGTGIFNKYVDMHPAPGNNYYRLKIESDGSISYSPIRTVLFNKSYEQVSLYNSIGQKIRQGWSGDVEHWKAELSNGVYFLQYNSHNEKFLKQQ